MLKITEQAIYNTLEAIIKKRYKVAAILFGGSRVINLQNSASDYDLTVLLEPESFQQAELDAKVFGHSIPEYIKYNDNLIHWYYTSPDCEQNKFYHFDLWSIEAVYGYATYNSILKVWNSTTLAKYMQSLKNYLPTALDNCLSMYKELIASIIEKPLLETGFEITKEVYHLCTINILLKNGVLTEQDRVFLKTVKTYAKQNDTFISTRLQNTYDLEVIKKVKLNITELQQNAETYKMQYQKIKDTL
jgi:hypothetical protein